MSPLHLIRLPVLMQRFARFAAERNIGWSEGRGRDGRAQTLSFDEGLALHHLLTETFGRAVLQPFRLLVAQGAERASLYAYSTSTGAALADAARTFASPEADGICDPELLESKVMPDIWRKGQRLGFDVRIRPVSRLLKPLPKSKGEAFRKGAEIDVFLAEALRLLPTEAGDDGTMQAAGRNREVVYNDWLAARLGASAVLEAGTTRLAHFRRSRIVRTAKGPDGPDAILQGTLTVLDPDMFTEKLAKGIGRHRAYGYGMLLLRPPGTNPMES
ncbi:MULTISPECIES: type I-E CRISPR-associated protein Cas6/Cse3/CasE [unclassified Aurantimonas]|uniref:type I-E CRISPR-associated protein Cas6/Cse3/CasE n=1 Tax=unclassified Aurantimonas TaxID=2638230 RepID=UPI002E170320|nr:MULTISPECIES: type I-E CRISPR-associated protein Cas6/Cse3/CasE [unclassified Aurantimonas]MEC5293084.1 type I-E CRISPR-associated protein Cas6/Cse3/CasE [Aurantimonas sp. C2-3-R2]MEC5414124.1 type I-E CRISPR-associated protein Cas6/Cse3/CasE [Aurantimonas sp. C2-4-R8]